MCSAIVGLDFLAPRGRPALPLRGGPPTPGAFPGSSTALIWCCRSRGVAGTKGCGSCCCGGRASARHARPIRASWAWILGTFQIASPPSARPTARRSPSGLQARDQIGPLSCGSENTRDPVWELHRVEVPGRQPPAVRAGSDHCPFSPKAGHPPRGACVPGLDHPPGGAKRQVVAVWIEGEVVPAGRQRRPQERDLAPVRQVPKADQIVVIHPGQQFAVGTDAKV